MDYVMRSAFADFPGKGRFGASELCASVSRGRERMYCACPNIRLRRLSRGDAVNDFFKNLEVDGFGEVGGETGFGTFAQIDVLAEAAEGDSLDVEAGGEVAHDVEAAAVGEADVGEEEVEFFDFSGGDGFLDGGGGGGGAAEGLEEFDEDAAGVTVVFDDEDVGIGCLRPGWRRDGLERLAAWEAASWKRSVKVAFAGSLTEGGDGLVHFDDGGFDYGQAAETAELAGDGLLALFERFEERGRVRSMPTPLSAISISRVPFSFAVRMVMPFTGVNLMALERRLRRTCWNRPASAQMWCASREGGRC